MRPCLSEGQDSAPSTRTQEPVLPSRKPTQALGLTSPTRGQTQEARGTRPRRLQKGDHKYSKLDEMRQQKKYIADEGARLKTHKNK